MPTVACAGQKGGSGKSTAALALAAELVARGLRVLLVDADPQGSARTWGAVANENGHAAPTVVAMGADLYKPGQLPALTGSFDWVIIDTPPRQAETQRAALMVADLAILPCGPSAMDAWALAETVEQVQAAQRVRPHLRAAVLLTRTVARTAISRGARDVLADVGLPVLRSELGFRVAYQEAPAAGLGPAQYEPSSEAAEEVRALTDEVLAVLGETKSKKKR